MTLVDKPWQHLFLLGPIFYALLRKHIIFIVCIIFSATCSADEVPPGFDLLPETETTIVDIFFGRKEIVKTKAIFDENEITFLKPQDIVKHISNLKDPEKVMKLLSQPLPTNEHMVCKKKNPTPECNYVKTKTVAVIFNPRKYKAIIIINAAYFLPSEKPTLEYVACSTGALAYVNQMNLDFSTDQNQSTFTANNNGVGSRGNASVVTNWDNTYLENKVTRTTTNIILAQDLYFNYLYRHLNYRFGLTQSEGSILVPSFPVFGAKLSTTGRLAYNSSQLSSTPIQLEITAPSFVNIYRGPSLISTQYFQPGLHYLDTTNFPTGAYLLTIRIQNIYNAVTTRQRFFVKINKVPLLGHPDYYFVLGRIRNTFRISNFNDLIGPAENTIINGGGHIRLSPLWAIRYAMLGAKSELLAGAGITRLFSNGDIGIGGLYTNHGNSGIGVDTDLFFFNHINFTTLYRYLDLSNPEASLLQAKNHYESNVSTGLSYGISSRLRAGFTLSISHKKGQQGIRHNFGFSINWIALKTGSTKITAGLNNNFSNTESLVELALTFTFADNGYSISAQHEQPKELRRASEIEQPQTTSLLIDVDKKQYNAGASFTQGSNYTSWGVNTGFHNSNLALKMRFLNNHTNSTTTRISGGNLITTLILNKRGLLLRKDIKSGASVYIKSKKTADFDFLSGRQVVGTVTSNTNSFINLSPYQVYTLRPESNSGEPFIFSPKVSKEITLYPGNIQILNFSAESAFNLITTFIYPNGKPVKDMEVTGGIEETRTDDIGMASVTTQNGATLTLSNGKDTCRAKIHNIQEEDGIAFVDNIICQP